MKLENRLPAEGINASQEHPLKEFAWLVCGAVGVLVLAVVALAYGAQWLAPRIPFEYEARLVGDRLSGEPANEADRAAQAELQLLADRLAARMVLPAGMRVRVSYRDAPTVNAFATLGGHATFFRGLLENLSSEDALAMVVAHEIAHLKHRHPAAALGRGIAAGIVLSLVSVDLGRSAAGSLLGQAGVVTLLSFNRDQEREADEEALRVLAAEYGHVGGAVDLFEVFARKQAEQGTLAASPIEFLATHPLTASRIEGVRRWAVDHRIQAEGPRRALSPALASARERARERENGAERGKPVHPAH